MAERLGEQQRDDTSASSSHSQRSDQQQHPLYKGSCHCGFFTYTARLNLTGPNPLLGGATITKCNCTICHKTGATLTAPEPGSLTITSPPKGREGLLDYRFGAKRIGRLTCPRCGVNCVIEGRLEFEKGSLEVLRVNVLTVDARVDGEKMVELKDIKIMYLPGRSGEWEKGMSKEPWEFGVW